MSRRFMIYDFDTDTLAANERPVLTTKNGRRLTDRVQHIPAGSPLPAFNPDRETA